MLPQTVLLNARPDSAKPLFFSRRGNSSDGTLRVFDRTRLAQVDGQHRIEGIRRASEDEGAGWTFELPAAIVDGLSLAQEAAQFLTINTKQTKVKMDLELRVIASRSEAEANRLANALGFEEWRLRALRLAIALDEKPSPWRNAITGPDDTQREVISEQTFVQSLSLLCQQSRSTGRADVSEVARFLADYWRVIADEYPDAWGEGWKSYLLRKTPGVYSFHFLAALVHDVCEVRYGRTDRKAVRDVMKEVLTDRQSAWRARTGRIAAFGTGGASWTRIANEFGVRLLPGFKVNPRSLRALEQKATTRILARAVASASSMLSPLGLREFTNENVKRMAPGGSGGVYVLLALGKAAPTRVYVGKSDAGLAKRVWAHSKDKTAWDLFSCSASARPAMISALEGALYHLTPSQLPSNNRVEPVNCPF